MPNRKIDVLVFGTALSLSMVTIFVLCNFAAYLKPSVAATHNWVRLFTDEPPGTHRSMVEGIITTITASWIFSVVFGFSFNFLERSKT